MEIIEQWNEEDSDYIRQRLIEYNQSKLPQMEEMPYGKISFVVKDDGNEIKGGLTCRYNWGRMHLDILWLHEELRQSGIGTELLRKAEDYAVAKGCTLLYTDTFSFQAPDFYLKNGFTTIGVIEDHPKGENQYFLMKRLLKP